MTQSTYNKANKLQEEISKLVYELEVLEQNLFKPTSVRFGTNFNVSIPIEFDMEVYAEAIKQQMNIHLAKLQLIKNEFNQL